MIPGGISGPEARRDMRYPTAMQPCSHAVMHIKLTNPQDNVVVVKSGVPHCRLFTPELGFASDVGLKPY